MNAAFLSKIGRRQLSRYMLCAACCTLVMVCMTSAAQTISSPAKKKTSAPAGAASHRTAASRSKAGASRSAKSATGAKGARDAKGAKGKKSGVKGKKSARVRTVAPTAESRRLTSAFTASSLLRPMAQQLLVTRTPAAFAGVANYAAVHGGDAAATAELAMGHAYALDRRYTEAQAAFRLAARGDALADYADFLGAQAAVQASRSGDAIPLLEHFADRHPGSIFVGNAPVVLANAYVEQGNGAAAVRALSALQGTPAANRADARLALARAFQASGQTAQAAELYRGIYLRDALSVEAATAKTQLAAMNVPLSAAERKQHADALFNAKQYAQAQAEYRALQRSDAGLGAADLDALEIYAAVCDLRLKRLGKAEVEALPVTSDDTAALKMYLESELLRNDDRFDEHDALIARMVAQYPHSRWLEEALLSGGNMYLVKHDNERAAADYTMLVRQFPTSAYAPSAHWHAAWLNYRLRRWPEAARLMEEQIASYPAGPEVPGALYWRGRLYEDVEHDYGQALNFYAAVNAAYVNTYYGILARQRSAVLGVRPQPAPAAVLAAVRKADTPELTDALPENDPHLIKARLLANAALNEYIGPEISASPTSAQWGALAQAEIYQSFGETTRALQSMKRSKLPYLSLPVAEVPIIYWQVLFPRPYWDAIVANAQRNSVDPFLVAALIRQESEFNPGAVSKANAYGLMQLLPSVGKSEARKEGVHKFSTNTLLDPVANIELGTDDLRRTLDRYNGQVEYALASYNAGDTPVHAWIAQGGYADTPEWVESIPYTETRDYVQSIVRNEAIYRAVYGSK